MFAKKWVLSAFIICSLLVGLSQVFLQSQFVSDKIKGTVENRLKKILKKEVSIGHVRISLVSSVLIVEEIAIHSDSTRLLPLFFAKKIHISFSPVSFFKETLFIRKITIDDPVFSLNAQNNLQGNLNTMPDLSGPTVSPSLDKNQKPLSVPVMIRSIRLKSGSLSYKGGQMVKEISLLNINGEIRPNFAMSHFEIDLVGKGGHYVLEGISGKLSRLEGKMSIQPEKIVIKRVLLASSHGKMLTSGEVRLKEKDPFDLQIDLGLPLENLDFNKIVRGDTSIFHEKHLSGNIRFMGKLRGDYPDFSIEGKSKLTNFQVGDEAVASAEAELLYQDGAISIPSFSGNIFSGAFSGVAEINIKTMFASTEGKGRRPLFVVALSVKDLPLYPVTQLASKKGEKTALALRGIAASGELVVSDMGIKERQLQGSGQLSLTRQARFSPTLTKTASPLVRLGRLFMKGGLQWDLAKGHLDFSRGKLFFPDTEMRFDGTWQDSEGLTLNAALNSTEIRTVAEAFHFPLSGRSHVSGVFKGAPTGLSSKKEPLPEFKGTIKLQNWTILNQPFAKLSAHVEVRGKQIHFKQGLLKGRSSALNGDQWLPPSEILFGGELHLDKLKSPYFNFQTRLKAGNAQEVFGFFDLKIPLYTLASGRLTINGRPKDFSVKGILSLSEGWLYGEHFDQGSVDLTVTQEKVLLRDAIFQRGKSRLTGEGEIGYEQHFSLSLKGHKLRLEETDFLNQHFPDLQGKIELSVEGGGQFKKPALQFRAQFETLRYHKINMLKGSIRADWIGPKVDFNAAFPERHLSIVGSVHLTQDYPFAFHSRFLGLKIDHLLKDRLTEPLKDIALLATGELTGKGELTHLDALSFSAQFSDLAADFGNYQLKNNGPLSLVAKDGVLLFDQASFIGQNTALTLNGSLSLLKRWDLFVKGEADLALLSYFSKTISSGSGKAILDLSVTDTWEAPRLRGQLTLNSGKVRMARLAQSIGINSLSVLFNEQQLILENMEGQLGGGRFQLVGKAKMAGFAFSAFGLFLSLDQTRVMLAPNLPATLSGELFFQGQEKQQVLKGDLHLLRLVYDKQINLKTLVGDLRETGGDVLPSEDDRLGQTALNIHFLGDQGLRIENNVAKAPLGIDLLLKGTIGNPILVGRVDVPKGEVFFLKNTFRVLSGSVDFFNPKKIDPTFNMEASTEVRNVITDRNYKIDLSLSGTVSQVTLRFNSFPDLPEDDILALLAIGKTSADLDQVKGGAGTEAGNIAVGEFLSESVNEISGVVGDPLEELTGARLKVDPYISGTDSRTTTGTRLTAEKRLLKDQLLVIYSTTLDPNEEDLIKMVYEVSRNVSLIGNRDDSGQIGGDLRFRFEFR